jgi:hypothetical protein
MATSVPHQALANCSGALTRILPRRPSILLFASFINSHNHAVESANLAEVNGKTCRLRSINLIWRNPFRGARIRTSAAYR